MTERPNLLVGAEEIAECFYGVADSRNIRRVYKMFATTDEPHRFRMFKRGGLLCSRRSWIEERIERQADAANDRHRLPKDAA